MVGATSPGGLSEGSSLRIQDVRKNFPAPANPDARTAALDGVTLSVAAGELVSIVGPSAERGLVFQDPNLFPWLTVRRNIQSGLVARGLLHRKRGEVDEFMRLVGLEASAHAFPHHLSGGMAQRVALARALINHPKILLLDEPLGALDAFTRMRMQDEVLRLWRARGTTMLLVTHDIDEAIYMSDRIAIMTPAPGRIDQTITVGLERPRQRNSPEFVRLRGEILELLHLAGSAANDAETSTSLNPGKPGRTVADAPDEISGPAPAASAGAGSERLDADVIIIGGGPAGSTLGAYLSGARISHLILDQAVHPRRHVGESLVCSTTRIFQEIGFLPVMEREQFVHKHGAVWTHWADLRKHVIRFREIPELGLSQNYTYHVDRGCFDELLLKHAATMGSKVLQNARVERVEFDPYGFATGVRVRQGDEDRLLRCRLLVDASGRSTLLGSQLRLKRNDPLFNQFAVHNWFERVDRGADETSDYIHIHVLPMPRAWVWLIPINETTTSVGVVTQGNDFVKGGEPAGEFFARHIRSHPLLAEQMAGARPLHEFTREGNYSYVMDRFAGNGWLLIGDAARFVDPVFSSGVSVALESAKRAADAILAARGNFSAASFAGYEQTLRAGVDIWREFINLYYQLPPLFLDLITRPDARWQLTRLLQGDVYDRATVPILESMRDEIAAVANNRDHPWHAHLGAPASPH
jgi:FADH2 O2-dependent halogenase